GELGRRRTARTRNELLALIEERINRYVLRQISSSGQLDAMVDALEKRREDPYAIVTKLLAAFLR
ncbi:MAG TPA: methylmalonyl Co-A mutase-associated GTPase MeaB, partial [Negativicutes bacterium]|nr:methylmalonyl Co-A mutase-associated GTPase MeaB [Negativicutes bacterium]